MHVLVCIWLVFFNVKLDPDIVSALREIDKATRSQTAASNNMRLIPLATSEGIPCLCGLHLVSFCSCVAPGY